MAWNYDGPITAEKSEARLQKKGYVLEFCCTYCGPQPPPDFISPGRGSTGWDFRRAISVMNFDEIC